MWFSFSTNFLIFITAVTLYFFYNKGSVSIYYRIFILFTGIAALVAGFGHLPVFELSTGLKILYVSRVINFISVYCFIYGTLRSFNYLRHETYLGIQVSICFYSRYCILYFRFDNSRGDELSAQL